ncbi:hypothetical protein ZIOFF_005799 [Zingiber officinale]|uniref:PROP1-like PPR domain-containing protein n=1 Tax=Zingiber officinale TaxID=94328 RepID=A0A8J5HUQ2_ZINOF|nr:hypothetical protein ZIOFF_005799 [Zingiber officinale]
MGSGMAMSALRRATALSARDHSISNMMARGSFNGSELSRNSLVHEKGKFCLCSGILENYLLSKSYSSRCYNFARSFLWSRNISSNVGARSGEKDNDSEDGFPDIDEPADGTVEPDEEVENEELYTEGGILDIESDSVGNRSLKNRVEPLLEAIIRAPRHSVNDVFIKWVEEGNSLGRGEISHVMLNLRKRRLYTKALQFLDWLEANKRIEFMEHDYASRLNMICKLDGLQKAEHYIQKIPVSHRGEVVYRTLLANCVTTNNLRKAEEVFNRIKDLGLPITKFICNQLLMLYKRVDQKKMPEVLAMMEKENIKPTLLTHRLLIDTKGRANDISGMEQIIDTMKAEELKPDLTIQWTVAKYYISAGLNQKAETLLKEMEGDDIQKNYVARKVLLPLYAALGKADDVGRIWEICKSSQRLDEYLAAIEAWGKLGNIEEAEEVFEDMIKVCTKVSARHYITLLKVYANNKCLSKGKDFAKRMMDDGCHIGPAAWDALINLYAETGELEKADSLLRQASQRTENKPHYSSYMTLLDKYSEKGDIQNAEKIFQRLRQAGYVGRLKPYQYLLQAYNNAKAPAYGFKDRMKAENMRPNRAMTAQLVVADALISTMLHLLDHPTFSDAGKMLSLWQSRRCSALSFLCGSVHAVAPDGEQPIFVATLTVVYLHLDRSPSSMFYGSTTIIRKATSTAISSPCPLKLFSLAPLSVDAPCRYPQDGLGTHKSHSIRNIVACGCFNGSELSRNSLVQEKGNFHLCSGILDYFSLSKSYSSRCSNFARSFLWPRNLSSHVGAKLSEKDNDSEDRFSELDEPAEDMVEPDERVENKEFETEEGILGGESDSVGNRSLGKRVESPLSMAIIRAPRHSLNIVLNKWVEDGNPLGQGAISHAMLILRKSRVYAKALQFIEWLEENKRIDFLERDYASHLDLVCKLYGFQKAENYLQKIPVSLQGEVVYRTLLTNCVLANNVRKAEEVFNKIKDLGLPITKFTCNQLLVLYKRVDQKKIADVLVMMEKENIKPSLLTYRLLVDNKGRASDIVGMEKIIDTMKDEGLKPDLTIQGMAVKYYSLAGLNEKAEAVLKDMEGDHIQENHVARKVLLPLYAALGKAEDVGRIWEICKSSQRLDECLTAIEAWGKLGNVEKAEEVFENMIKVWTKVSAKHYVALLNVYANNKLLSKGKDFAKRMSDDGCHIGPATWDALVKLYVEAGELEKAASILQKASQRTEDKPLFVSYMTVFEKYSKKGDIHNAEKIFQRLRQAGYAGRLKPYQYLLQAYINAKKPAYGFRDRMKADNMFPNKAMIAQLIAADALIKSKISDLLD